MRPARSAGDMEATPVTARVALVTYNFHYLKCDYIFPAWSFVSYK